VEGTDGRAFGPIRIPDYCNYSPFCFAMISFATFCGTSA
jgi:hypothetical protein